MKIYKMSRSIGRFNVIKELYKSNSSSIYRVKNKKEYAVLKVADSDFESLKYEYEITRSLNIDGVITFTGIEYIDNSLVIIQEDTDSESLDIILKERKLTEDEAKVVIYKLIVTLSEIHSQNIIHKNLNPGNILWNKKTGVLKVIDLGIASRVIPDIFSENTDIKNNEFSSPEQKGDIDYSIDFRSDIYSLGVVIYKLITNYIYDTKDVTSAFYTIIEKMTKTIPDERFSSMSEVVHEFNSEINDIDFLNSHFLNNRLADVMGTSSFIVDIKTKKLLYIHKTFYTELGYSCDEIMNKKYDELEFPIIKTILIELISNRVWEGSLQFVGNEGRRVYTHSRLSVFDDPEFGSLIFADITILPELGKTIGILDETEKRYKALFNQLAVGVARVDLNSKWLEVNDKFCEIVGYSREDLLHLTFADFTHPDDLETDILHLEKLISKEAETFNIDKRYIKRSGDIVWVNLTVNLVYDSCNNPSYFVGVIKDITERKLLTEDLDRVNRLLLQTGRLAKVGGWEIDLISMIPYFTEETANIYELDPGETLNVDEGISFYAPEARNIISKAVDNAINNNKPYDLELPFITKKGKKLWIRTIGKIETQNNKPVKLYGVIQDITDKKSIEEKLKKNIEFTNSVINSLTDTFYILGLKDGKGIQWNKSLLDISGYDEEYFRNNTPMSSYPVEEHPLIEEAMHTVVQNGRSTVELTYIVKSGRRIPYEYSLVPIKSPDGDEWICSIGRDITKRKEFERELKELRNYLESIIDSMPSVIIGVDNCGLITQWNAKASTYTGIGKSHAIGKDIEELKLNMDDVIKLVKGAVLKNKELKKNRQIVMNSRVQHESVFAFPLVDSDIKGAVIRIDDVTNEIELQQKLSHSQKMEALGELAGGIAHDFNNTLAGILGAAQLIENNKDSIDKLSLKYIKIIIEATIKASKSIGKLLTFSRKVKVPSVIYNLNDIVDDSLTLLERTIDKKIAINLKKEARNVNSVGDSSAIQNAILNIVINSSQAMPDGGEIIVKTDNIYLDNEYCKYSPFEISAGEYISIEISDTGIGIPQEITNKIFDPFFTTKSEGKGSGLGLATVYGTVKDHHGAIEVSSIVGSGTRFCLYLPCSDGIIEDKKTDFGVSSGTGTILLIEDDDIVRLTTETLLDTMGYKVLVAEDGLKGIEIYKKYTDFIDMVLCDMIMPGLSGSETFKKLKNVNQDCKVVICSGYTREEVLIELKEEGLRGFIQKPFDAKELEKLIYNTINQ